MISNPIMHKAIWNDKTSITHMQTNINISYDSGHNYVKHNMKLCEKQNEIIWFLTQLCKQNTWHHMSSDTSMHNTTLIHMVSGTIMQTRNIWIHLISDNCAKTDNNHMKSKYYWHKYATTKTYEFIWYLTQFYKTNNMDSNDCWHNYANTHECVWLPIQLWKKQSEIIWFLLQIGKTTFSKPYEFWHNNVKHNMSSCITTKWNHMISDTIMQTQNNHT